MKVYEGSPLYTWSKPSRLVIGISWDLCTCTRGLVMRRLRVNESLETRLLDLGEFSFACLREFCVGRAFNVLCAVLLYPCNTVKYFPGYLSDIC